MSKHLPPIPPASRSPKGPGGDRKAPLNNGNNQTNPNADRNYDQQGQQGNSNINTHNQGYQQDR